MPAYILQVDTRENVYYVVKTSYYIIEKGSTYTWEKKYSNALWICIVQLDVYGLSLAIL
jgi:hypothetical protein